jgi:hypothetical protein
VFEQELVERQGSVESPVNEHRRLCFY